MKGIPMRSWGGIGLLTLIVGCGAPVTSTESPSDKGATSAAKPQAVTIALNWFPEAEHGGYYAALVHGYYDEVGLDVTILPGGPNTPVLQQAAAGRVDFAVDNADKLLLARAQEADVVAVMAPIQNSPRCLLVHAESGINSFDDLARQSGFTIAMSVGQPFSRFLSKRLDLSRLTITPYSGNVAPFLLNKKLALQGYSFSEPFVARKQGADPKLLMVSDLGFNTYTSLLVTGRSHIDEHPELVLKVVAASIRGWRKYLEAPEETNAYIHQKNPEMDLDVLAYGARDLQALCLPEGVELGTLTAERWTTLVEQLREIDALPANSEPPGRTFTAEFLPRD
jgi:NitT/TauT family transport system substrate-binding protein